MLLVRHVLDGVSLGTFACKRVPVGNDHEWLEKVLTEVQLLQTLSHQNLVSYRHVWLEDYQTTNFGPRIPCAFILQQYCNSGDLHSYITDSARSAPTNEQLKERMRRRSKGQLETPSDLNGPRRMHFEEILSFFRDITAGLNHLHFNGYIHRDLKPSNCLLHNSGHKLRVLVSDFGEVQVADMVRKSTGATGTISYCAPEVLRHEGKGEEGPLGNFTTKSDIFSLGMIVYFMCFARLPYRNADGIDEENEDLDRLREEISMWAGFDDERRVRSDLPEKLYKSLRHLLALNPDDRPGTEEILHVFKSPSVFDEFGAIPGPIPMNLDEIGPRISRADTPSPAPSSHIHAHRKKSSATHFSRPGPSKLRSSVVESSDASRSPSPPSQQLNGTTRTPTPPESSVILRPRKVDVSRSPHSPTRLMLPPPPTPRSRMLHLVSNPTFVGTVKLALFGLKVASLFAPCQPWAARSWVAYPLLCLASLDFVDYRTLGTRAEGRVRIGRVNLSVLLCVVHAVVVGVALRMGRLCVGRGWEPLET